MATITNYRDLVCWQLSVMLRDELIAITDRPRVRCCRLAKRAVRAAEGLEAHLERRIRGAE